MRTLSAVLVGVVVAACGPKIEPLPVAKGCQPLLGGSDCLLPYPSDFFRVTDATQPSGARITVSDAAAPKSKEGKRYDVTAEFPIDGFSMVPTIVATLGVEVSPERFVALEQGGAASLSKAT